MRIRRARDIAIIIKYRKWSVSEWPKSVFLIRSELVHMVQDYRETDDSRNNVGNRLGNKMVDKVQIFPR